MTREEDEPVGPLAGSHGRWNVISALEDLSSSTMQQAWRLQDETEEWLFTLAVNTLLDDWGILEYLHDLIGNTHRDIFRNKAEAMAVKDVADKLHALNARLKEKPAKAYVEAPEWPAISQAANAALGLMSA